MRTFFIALLFCSLAGFGFLALTGEIDFSGPETAPSFVESSSSITAEVNEKCRRLQIELTEKFPAQEWPIKALAAKARARSLHQALSRTPLENPEMDFMSALADNADDILKNSNLYERGIFSEYLRPDVKVHGTKYTNPDHLIKRLKEEILITTHFTCKEDTDHEDIVFYHSSPSFDLMKMELSGECWRLDRNGLWIIHNSVHGDQFRKFTKALTSWQPDKT